MAAPVPIPATLYVVATPIGNLGDLSPRAAAVLRAVAHIAAEDTRETRKLADHVGSNAHLIALHAHSDPARISQVVQYLTDGQPVAMTTDAGTPAVSDPGAALVRAARDRGVQVVPVPGPSAVATLLSVSGFPADRYLFMGFAPRKGAERREWLVRIRDATDTVVCFEAPSRTEALLTDLAESCGPGRQAAVGRELTKKFEDIKVDSLEGLAESIRSSTVRGEITIAIAGAVQVRESGDLDLAQRLAHSLAGNGVERSRAAKIVAEVSGMSRNESYKLVNQMGEA